MPSRCWMSRKLTPAYSTLGGANRQGGLLSFEAEEETTPVRSTYFDDELGGRWGGEGQLEFLNDVEIACFRYADGRDFGCKAGGSHNVDV